LRSIDEGVAVALRLDDPLVPAALEVVGASRTGRAKGKPPQPPDATPRPEEQSNLSDPDSRLMRKSKSHEYRQAYNAQAVVDAEGSQLGSPAPKGFRITFWQSRA
jgi:hypothetical protein